MVGSPFEANNQPYLKSEACARYVDVLSINSLYEVYLCHILLYKKCSYEMLAFLSNVSVLHLSQNG